MNEKECIALAKHMIGMDNKKVYTRHGRKFYRPYRNYFSAAPTGKDYELCNELVKEGYAKETELSIHTYGKCFYLTRKGLDWLGEKLGVHIYDEVK